MKRKTKDIIYMITITLWIATLGIPVYIFTYTFFSVYLIKGQIDTLFLALGIMYTFFIWIPLLTIKGFLGDTLLKTYRLYKK